MTGLGALIRRNCKLFFKDKGMFFTSLITPVILLVLYAPAAGFYQEVYLGPLEGYGVEDWPRSTGIPLPPPCPRASRWMRR